MPTDQQNATLESLERRLDHSMMLRTSLLVEQYRRNRDPRCTRPDRLLCDAMVESMNDIIEWINEEIRARRREVENAD